MIPPLLKLAEKLELVPRQWSRCRQKDYLIDNCYTKGKRK